MGGVPQHWSPACAPSFSFHPVSFTACLHVWLGASSSKIQQSEATALNIHALMKTFSLQITLGTVSTDLSSPFVYVLPELDLLARAPKRSSC